MPSVLVTSLVTLKTANLASSKFSPSAGSDWLSLGESLLPLSVPGYCSCAARRHIRSMSRTPPTDAIPGDDQNGKRSRTVAAEEERLQKESVSIIPDSSMRRDQSITKLMTTTTSETGISSSGQLLFTDSFPASITSSSPLKTELEAGGLHQKDLAQFAEDTRPVSRRLKTHVASACVNCKKKHLGCDAARPCRRCVLAGKAATCVDVTHKKRGRPPLRTGGSSQRVVAPRINPLETPVIGDQLGTTGVHLQRTRHAQQRQELGHRTTSSRELRPMTDLLTPSGAAGSFILPPSSEHLSTWPAVISSPFSSRQSVDLYTSATIGPVQRSYSVGSFQHIAEPSQRHQVQVPIVPGPPASLERHVSSYATYPPPLSPPSYRLVESFGADVSPSSALHRPKISRRLNAEDDSSIPYEQRSSYLHPSVRLPPILSTLARTPDLKAPTPTLQQARRLSDSYSDPIPWPIRSRERAETRADHGSELPLAEQRYARSMFPAESLSHRSSGPLLRPLARDFSEPSHGPETAARISNLAGFMSDNAGMAPPAVTTGAGSGTQPADETRPVKRRKMTLHDIVND